MSDPAPSRERPLEAAADNALSALVGDLRKVLLSEAAKMAAGDQITEDDLHLAYKRLSYPAADSLQFNDAQAVISKALDENRIIEWVSYVMAVTLFLFGLVLLGVGAFHNDPATRWGCLAGGSLVEVLILLPFRFAINSRRHNIALRMLGLIINRVDDPKKLAPLLKDTFLAVVVGIPQLDTRNER